MDAWIVSGKWDCEGGPILGAYASQQEAKAKALAAVAEDRYDFVELVHFNGGTKLGEYTVDRLGGLWRWDGGEKRAVRAMWQAEAPKRVGFRTAADQLDDEGRN